MSIGLLTLPRRFAPVALIVGACYMTLNQGISLGPFSFSVIRLLVLAGVIRVLLRGEKPTGGVCSLDWAMMAWALCAILSSPFHEDPSDALVFRFGQVYNVLGIYYLIRCFCRSTEDVVHLAKMTALLLLPVALEMIGEQLIRRNLFAVFGGGSEAVTERAGRFRARGPFAHAILAGTVGAICLPLMIGIWRKHPIVAKIGVVTCLVMVVTSNSSGPIMSVGFSVFALLLWRWRHLTRQMRVAAVVGYIALELVMSAPAYYLIARIDLTGGSTGWHRARLIESSIKHLDEWWLAGTDYTRHWMPTGVSWSPNHADITNYYIKMGVIGGLPLMLLLILAFALGFRYIGQTMRDLDQAGGADQFFVWALGCSLFSHAASSISISYFDQSYLFIYLTLACIASLHASARGMVNAGEEHPHEIIDHAEQPDSSLSSVSRSI